MNHIWIYIGSGTEFGSEFEYGYEFEFDLNLNGSESDSGSEFESGSESQHESGSVCCSELHVAKYERKQVRNKSEQQI